MAPERPTTKAVPNMRKRLVGTISVWHIAGTKSIGWPAAAPTPAMDLEIKLYFSSVDTD